MDISIILPWTASLEQSQLQIGSTILSIIISLAALSFSIYFSWQFYWRKGKIIVSDPLLYGILVGHNEPTSLSMQIPLVFLNEGGATRFIQDLILVLQQNRNESNELYFARVSSLMYADKTDEKDDRMAQQIAIEGHKAYSAVFFFYRKPGRFAPSPGVCKAKLKAKIDGEDWEYVHEFDFTIKNGQNLHVLGSDYCDGREIG